MRPSGACPAAGNVPTTAPLIVTTTRPVLPSGVMTMASGSVVPPTTRTLDPGAVGSRWTPATATSTVWETGPDAAPSSVARNAAWEVPATVGTNENVGPVPVA